MSKLKQMHQKAAGIDRQQGKRIKTSYNKKAACFQSRRDAIIIEMNNFRGSRRIWNPIFYNNISPARSGSGGLSGFRNFNAFALIEAAKRFLSACRMVQ